MKITIYQKPTCTTCKEVYKILKEKNVDFNAVNYYIEPISKEKLKSLLKKMNMNATDILRTKELIYTELKIAEQNLNNDKLIELMSQYPDLIQRPIVETETKAILARPSKKIKEIL